MEIVNGRTHDRNILTMLGNTISHPYLRIPIMVMVMIPGNIMKKTNNVEKVEGRRNRGTWDSRPSLDGRLQMRTQLVSIRARP